MSRQRSRLRATTNANGQLGLNPKDNTRSREGEPQNSRVSLIKSWRFQSWDPQASEHATKIMLYCMRFVREQDVVMRQISLRTTAFTFAIATERMSCWKSPRLNCSACTVTLSHTLSPTPTKLAGDNTSKKTTHRHGSTRWKHPNMGTLRGTLVRGHLRDCIGERAAQAGRWTT